MRAHFPSYEYSDILALQHELLWQGLGVNHLRLILGTSMGCMHSWTWGEKYPEDMDAPDATGMSPVQIAGRNRLWRKTVIDGIHNDPEWKNGDYSSEPRAGLEIATDLLLIAAAFAPLRLQRDLPTRDAADHFLDGFASVSVPNSMLMTFFSPSVRPPITTPRPI